MTETIESPITDKRLSQKQQLPKFRANLLHILSLSPKRVDIELDPNYQWIKISPQFLYRLQANEENCAANFPLFNFDVINFDVKQKNVKDLKLFDGKFYTVSSQRENKEGKKIISNVVDNPVRTKEKNQSPFFEEQLKYDGKYYFLLSFKHDAIDGYDQEDFIVVIYHETEGLKVQKIDHIEYASSRNAEIIYIDGIPTLKITYWNPDAPGWVYEEGEYRDEITFDLKSLQTNTKNWFYSYRSYQTERFEFKK